MKRCHLCFFIILCCICFIGCQNRTELPAPSTDIPDFAYAGGETTIFNATSNAFTLPAPNLTEENLAKHIEGDFAFDQVFVTAPALLNPGLGPLFNNNSCVACHVKNGRSPHADEGDDLSGFLIRISVPGATQNEGALPVPNFGTQLQNKAVFGTQAEANFTKSEISKIISFVDSESITLTKPTYHLTNEYESFPSNIQISPRVAPPVFGLGLLEAIPATLLLSYADPQDENNDGISGKINYVWDVTSQSMKVGRFGWKAEMPTTLQQTASAYNEDMGVTNSVFPSESCLGQLNCEDDNEIDLSDEILEVTTFYVQTLAVPGVRNYNDEGVLRGKVLFEEANCSACHIPKLVTGNAKIASLSNQTIYAYTDLLLHDMGEDLSDNRPIYRAEGNEWRTPPLWGIGLLEVVNGHSQLLHDGRARGIKEAILWHGGEAENSKKTFQVMTVQEKEDLIKFLRSI